MEQSQKEERVERSRDRDSSRLHSYSLMATPVNVLMYAQELGDV